MWVSASLAVVLVLVLSCGTVAVWRKLREGQRMSIPGEFSSASWPRPTGTRHPGRDEPRYIVAVAPNGRYFIDQYGQPILVRGDSPWALMSDLGPAEAEQWFSSRERLGFNAAIISLLGATANGAPHDDGSTFDGLEPFTDGDVVAWQDPYWDRVHSYLRLAAQHGITVMLYPIDGWSIGHSFVPTSIEACTTYGTMVAQRFADLPNIVWMSGGDYFPATIDLAAGSDVDHCIDAMVRGIRATGDSRPFSMQLGYEKSISTDNPFWAARVDWSFVYTYLPTYRAVLEAYSRRPVMPTVLGEANYEGENNQPESPPTTNQTLRQQVMWALTSGAAGDFYGSQDWQFLDGWQSRLDTPAVTQVNRLRAFYEDLRWTDLEPDTQSVLVTSGRGEEITDDREVDVLQSDYVTACRTPDGAQAVVYLPGEHTITIDRSKLADGVIASWLDPATGQRRAAPLANRYTTPGLNADGGTDWLLVFDTV